MSTGPGLALMFSLWTAVRAFASGPIPDECPAPLIGMDMSATTYGALTSEVAWIGHEDDYSFVEIYGKDGRLTVRMFDNFPLNGTRTIDARFGEDPVGQWEKQNGVFVTSLRDGGRKMALVRFKSDPIAIETEKADPAFQRFGIDQRVLRRTSRPTNSRTTPASRPEQ